MKLRAEIKAQAKNNFMSQYGISIGAGLLYMILMGALGWTFIGTLLLVPPLIVGYSSFTIRIYRGQQGDIGDMFSTGFNDYGRNLGGVLWMYLFIWLWTLLFIIPGIIKALAYFMTPYILADSKNVSATDALKLSMRMTQGYKGEIFVMGLSFIGWAILTAITCGILGIFFTGPYFGTSFAGLYHELKANALAKGIVTPEELA
jgi:uncharacterized membrane protein